MPAPADLRPDDRRAPAAGDPAAGLPERGALDVVTRLAVRRVAEAPPHERLLALAGVPLAAFARRVSPPVSRSRLIGVFAQAEAYGRLSAEWAERLAAAVDVPEIDGEAILALFRIDEPSRPGRPRKIA